MNLFRLQNGDSQQLGRHVLRQPRSMVTRGARRMERKLGQAIAIGGVGGVVWVPN